MACYVADPSGTLEANQVCVLREGELLTSLSLSVEQEAEGAESHTGGVVGTSSSVAAGGGAYGGKVLVYKVQQVASQRLERLHLVHFLEVVHDEGYARFLQAHREVLICNGEGFADRIDGKVRLDACHADGLQVIHAKKVRGGKKWNAST